MRGAQAVTNFGLRDYADLLGAQGTVHAERFGGDPSVSNSTSTAPIVAPHLDQVPLQPTTVFVDATHQRLTFLQAEKSRSLHSTFAVTVQDALAARACQELHGDLIPAEVLRASPGMSQLRCPAGPAGPPLLRIATPLMATQQLQPLDTEHMNNNVVSSFFPLGISSFDVRSPLLPLT